MKKTFPILIQNFHKELERINSPEYILNYRLNAVHDFFDKVTTPHKNEQNNESVKIGKCETSFANFLLENFPDNIFTDLKLRINNTDKYYTPDVVYWNKKKGDLLVDIEIDEPYDLQTGVPIHYLGIDDMRNNFFCDNGWVVIRFTEEQVVKESEKCLTFLNDVISLLNSHKTLSHRAYDQTEIVKQQMWSKDEAHMLAYRKYRDTYS